MQICDLPTFTCSFIFVLRTIFQKCRGTLPKFVRPAGQTENQIREFRKSLFPPVRIGKYRGFPAGFPNQPGSVSDVLKISDRKTLPSLKPPDTKFIRPRQEAFSFFVRHVLLVPTFFFFFFFFIVFRASLFLTNFSFCLISLSFMSA